MLRVEKNLGWLVRGLVAAEGNHRVTVHIRDLGVEKLVRSLFAAEGNCRVTEHIKDLGVEKAEGNCRVTVHISDLGVEKLGLKPMPDCEH